MKQSNRIRKSLQPLHPIAQPKLSFKSPKSISRLYQNINRNNKIHLKFYVIISNNKKLNNLDYKITQSKRQNILNIFFNLYQQITVRNKKIWPGFALNGANIFIKSNNINAPTNSYRKLITYNNIHLIPSIKLYTLNYFQTF